VQGTAICLRDEGIKTIGNATEPMVGVRSAALAPLLPTRQLR
jgi:hypothetical protein